MDNRPHHAEVDESKPRLTSLLDNDMLSRIERLRIRSARRFTNRRRGEHLSGRSGSSIEFSDYRNYVEGDDIRRVDWNIFARLNRPFLKLYYEEEEQHVAILVDASSSMLFEQKLDRAKQLAAAFGVMGLLGDERVSAYGLNRADTAPARLPPCSKRGNMMKLFAFLEGITGGGDAPVEKEIDMFLRFHSGRGVAVILSDFLTFGDLRTPLNRIASAGLEVFAIQILGPSEIHPDLTGDVRLVDCETEGTLDVSSADELIQLYQDYRAGYEQNLATLCRQRSGRFVSISSQDSIEWVLFDLLRRKGWVA